MQNIFFGSRVVLAMGLIGACLSFSIRAADGEDVSSGIVARRSDRATTEASSDKTSVAPKPDPDEDDFAGVKDLFSQAFPVKVVAPKKEAPRDLSSAAAAKPEGNFRASEMVVTGMVWGNLSPKAIINGEIYGVGDVVKDGKIESIDAQGIVFLYKDKKYLFTRERALKSS